MAAKSGTKKGAKKAGAKSGVRLRGYIVISKTLVGDDYRDCKIIPAGDPFPAIYRQVFGPASEADCKKWVAKNCKKKPAK